MEACYKKDLLNVENITQAIVDASDKIEEIIGYEIMFGAVGGSYSFGLQNSTSDIDCYLVFDSNLFLDVIQKSICLSVQSKQAYVDFMCVSYGEILGEIEKYSAGVKHYPSILYRTNTEKEKNMGVKDVFRSDFKRSLLFRILLSDHMIYSEAAYRRRNEFRKGIFIRDIIDYQFTRIYGNYREVISRKQFVPVRKYLYTIHEICTSEALMDSPKRPPMSFLNLINNMLPGGTLKQKIVNLYEKNKRSKEDKTQDMFPQDAEINQFIVDRMNRIYDYLQLRISNDEILYF